MSTRFLSALRAVLLCTVLSCSSRYDADTPATGNSSSAHDLRAASSDPRPVAPEDRSADQWFELADQKTEEALYEEALEFAEKAIRAYEGRGDKEGVIRSKNLAGEIMWLSGRYAEARSWLLQAIDEGLPMLGSTHIIMAKCYNNLGVALDFLGEYDRALEQYHKALEIWQSSKDSVRMAVAQNNIGIVLKEKSEYEESSKHLEEALRIREAILGKDHIEVGSTLNNLGVIHRLRGDFDTAIQYYERSIIIRTEEWGDSHPSVANSVSNLGLIYQEKGDYDQAIAYHERALGVRMDALGEAHPSVAGSHENLGIAYEARGDLGKARSHHEQALKIRLAVLPEDHPDLAHSYTDLGAVYRLEGAYDRALDAHARALDLRRAAFGDDHQSVAESHIERGDVYRDLGAAAGAEASYQRGLAIQHRLFGAHHPGIAESYNRLGAVAAARGDQSQALALYRQALVANRPATRADGALDTLDGRALSDRVLLTTLAEQARLLAEPEQGRAEPDLEAALAASLAAVRCVERLRRAYQAQASKLFLAKEATAVYERGMRTALRLYRRSGRAEHAEVAFELAEKSKGALLLDALAEAEARRFAGIPDTLLARERQLRIDLASYERRLSEAQFGDLPGDSVQVVHWKAQVFGLARAYQALLDELERTYPAYYRLKYDVQTVRLADVRSRLLKDDAALVEYALGGDSLYVFVVTREDLEVVSVPGRDLERWIDALRGGITERRYHRYTEAAHELYRRLVAPVHPRLAGRQVIVVPDGVLNYVPFEALLTQPPDPNAPLQDYRRLAYLMDDVTIRYSYSATLLDALEGRSAVPAPRALVAFAPVFEDGLEPASDGAAWLAAHAERAPGLDDRVALPASRDEVLGIRALFDARAGLVERFFRPPAQVYLHRAASEEALKRLPLSDYRFIHLATHGVVNEEAPALSGVLLASPPGGTRSSGEAEDGILHLGEIYTLSLNADLVVLSACETGLGALARGEGLIGLTRGFLYAGARSVLVSLWNVQDEATARLMIDFYRNLLDGASRAEALHEAKRAMVRRELRYAAPFYWSSFVLIGS